MAIYTGPGNWSRTTYDLGGNPSITIYSELGGGKAYGYVKIGDHLIAKISTRVVYRYYFYIDHKQQEEWDTVYFTWSNSWFNIEEITGYGPMYNSSDIPSVTFTYNVHGYEYNNTSYWNVGLNSITELVIPDGATSIGNEVFRNLNNSQKRFITTHGIFNDEGIIGTLQEPSGSSTGYLLQGSGFLDTENYTSYTSLVIGSGVKVIGDRAFARSDNSSSFLYNVTVRGKVTSIGEQAFYTQRELPGIDFHEGPLAVGASAFYECNKLEYVNFNDNWAYTGNYNSGNLFYNCYKLKRISPRNVIRNIAGSMYRNCNYLTQVTINDNEVSTASNNRRYALLVDLFAGDPECLDEEGYLITEVNNNSLISPEILAIDWKNTWHRIIAYYTEKCLHLYHKRSHIEIRLYGQGTIPVKHEDIWYYLKAVELAQGSIHHEQTPLFVAHQGKWLQICW